MYHGGNGPAMRAILVVLLLLTLVLAGCAGKGKESDDNGGDPSGTSTTSGTSTKSGSGTTSTSQTSTGTTTGDGNATNQAPTAQLGASTAPGALQVNFTVDGADLDGDALQWTLAFGDGASTNGTGVPANTTHTYAAGGNYTATLRVSDGLANATSSVNVTLAAGAPASQDFEGEWSIGSVDIPFAATLAEAGCDPIEGMDGVFLALFDIDAATRGLAFTATVTAASTADSVLAWEVQFLDADCAIIAGGDYVDGHPPIMGTVPADAVHAWMASDGGASVTGTYHAG